MSLVGRLEDLALADIFQILSVGKKTGTLVISADKGSALVVFRDGLVVRAESDMMEQSLLKDIADVYKLTESTISLAENVRSGLQEKSYAEILLEFGAVSKEQLDRVAKKRIEKVVYHLLLLDEGDFQFELDDISLENNLNLDDKGWEVSKGLSPEYLLMEGARVYDETAHESFIPDGEEFEATEQDDDWGAPAPVRKDLSALRALTQELRFPNTTSEITLLILRFASDIFQRGVLFIVGQEQIMGLGQFGLEIEQADMKIRETKMDISGSPFFGEVLRTMQPFFGSLGKDAGTEFLIGVFGGKWPKEVAIFPIIAENRVVALLYCDNLSTGEPFSETEGLEIFIHQAGIALEKAILEKKLLDIGG